MGTGGGLVAGRLWAIALNTFREAVRDRVLHGVLGLGCFTLLFTLAIAALSLNQQERVVRDLGLGSISLFSVLVAIFLGSSLLYKEIERKTLYVILPKPITRAEFLLGKYLGICMTVYVFVAIMGALHLWLSALWAGASPAVAFGVMGGLLAALALGLWRMRDRTQVALLWSLVALAGCIWLARDTGAAVSGSLAQLALVCAEVAVLAGVALFFSAFSTPFLTGIFTLGVWVTGRSADDMGALKASQVGEVVRLVLRALAEIVPNLHLFVPGHTLLFGPGAAPWAYVTTSLAYGGAYVAISLLAGAVIFSRRDFP